VPDSVDWEAVARGSPVIVVYMALKHLSLIAQRLLEAGRSPAEPMAIISHATLPAQAVLETTLGNCIADAAASRLEPPALLVIGDVVRLRAGLDWLGALTGRSLIADPLGNRGRTETG
jgi:uroporphyrin-III C-methyltransferase